MIVKRFIFFDIKNEKTYGYVDSQYPYTIYIQLDLKGLDYIETLIHEGIHHWIFRIFGATSISTKLNCLYDMVDGFINTLSIKTIKDYYRYYKNV